MRKSLPFAESKVSASRDGRLVGGRKTPFGKSLEVESKGVHRPSVRSEILLYDDEKKIEFVNHITKEFIRDKEAVYFAFPVALAKPSFSYEIQNGWVDPSKDMLKGVGLEGFSVCHWDTATAGDADMDIDPVVASLVTIVIINPGV